MSDQRENLLSGGPIALEKGWALIPFIGEKSHYWRPDEVTGYARIHEGERVRFWKSLCGLEGATYKKVPPIHEGNWPRCKRCERTLRRQNHPQGILTLGAAV